MMQSVISRRGISRSLTLKMLLCLITVAFAFSVSAKNHLGTNETNCHFLENEDLDLHSTKNFNTTSASAAPCNVGTGVIGGFVFRDFNFDGTKTPEEPFQAGVEVFIFTTDINGNSIMAAPSVFTDAMGSYAFTGLNDLNTYRVEFVIPVGLDYLGSGQKGTNNGTSVQFASPGTCDISFGIAAEAEYYQDNPFVTTPCYINGAGTAGTQEGDALAFLAVEYTASGTNQNIELFTASEVGSLWGVSYNRKTKTIFSSAVLRRHMGFGPGGTGAIYLMDVNDMNNPSIAGIIDLNALGFTTGADPRLTDTGSVPAVFGVANHDANAWNEVAKMSIGDIDVSDDGKTLYAVNLLSKELITIDLAGYVETGAIPGAAEITSVPIPEFNCGADDWRPWALNHHAGDLYIGGVCSAESTQNIADLNATVVKYDGTTFTETFSFPLDYERGDPFNRDNDATNERNQWYPWTNDFSVMVTGQFNEFLVYPQPILSDIEFDVDGSLILGFLDRTGQQGGFRNYGPDAGNVDLVSTISGGDIVRVCNIGGTLSLEGSVAACSTPTGQNIAQGPNGQEYYWEDRYSFGTNPTDDLIVHAETALGGLAFFPGSGDIVSTVFDPLVNVDAGGFSWFNNEDGSVSRAYEVFASNGAQGFPGKSSGLGDLGLTGEQAPAELGNYVWLDCNGDGIQNSDEDPIEGMNVSLYDANGALVGSTTTDVDGEYLFTEPAVVIETSSDYYIVFGTMGQFDAATGNTTINGTLYQLTLANVGESPNPDSNDSDVVLLGSDAPTALQGQQAIRITTDCVGEANHTYDAGFSSGVVMVDVIPMDASCPDATDGSITVNANPIEDTATLEFSLDGGPFQASNMFTGLAPGTYMVTAQAAAGGSACGGSAMATVTIGSGVVPPPPTTQGFEICIDEVIPADMGLIANCSACTDGSTVVTSFYDAAVGGNLVFTGDVFDPVGEGVVAAGVTGDFTFYAQCACGPCQSDRTPVTLTVVDNPMPTILGDELICPGSQFTYTLEPINPLHSFEWEVIGGGLIVIGTNSTGTTFTIEAPDTPGAGPFTIQLTETGTAPTACVGTTTFEISIKETALACNDNVQVSLDPVGCAVITPDIILEGITGTGEGCYDVTITNQYGEDFGNKVTCDNIGDVLTVNVASVCEDNSCWGSIILEDKAAPIFDCPTDPIEVDCTFDLDDILPPTATDNCGTASVVLSDESTDSSDVCDGVSIVRTYTAIDAAGNVSGTCDQVINVNQPAAPVFPLDIIWQCDQYALYPNITDATPLGSVIPDNDPSTPNVLDVPFFLPSDWVNIAGSGTVDVAEGLYCNYAVTHSDDTLSICTGVKIVRTWSVLNWCTNQILLVDANGNDNVQVVKVVDSQAPIITGESFKMSANNPGEHPQECTTTEMIPLPDLYDNCGAVFLSIYTEVGEAVYVNGVNANDGAFVPEPGLTVGFHTITFVATDDCENIVTTPFQVEVVDEVEPTPVCDEITDVVLNSEGLAIVDAISFDDGSNDNCCIDRFEVKRESETDASYAEQITFDCSEHDENVLIMVKVVDCYENEATCSVQVRVEDKEAPTCSTPSDVTITCLTLADNNIDVTTIEGLEAEFGTATASDNCDASVTELDPVSDFSGCGNGFVTRRFQPTDVNGNVGEICEQNILVVYQPDYELIFPADFDGTCGDMPTEEGVIINSNGCDLIAVSHTDQVFDLSDDGACYKIIRRFEVINWCNYDTGEVAVEFADNFTSQVGETIDETTFSNAGRLIYTQTLKITDDVAPVLSYTGETEFCVNDACVEGNVSLPIDIDENCTDDLSIIWVLDAGNDGATDGEYDTLGSGQFTGVAPLGTHSLIYTVEDGCGNVSSTELIFTVVDCKAPTPYCNGGITIGLMDTNPPMVQIWASDLDAGSFDNCGGEVSIAFSPNPLDTGLVLTCNDLGPNTIEVYIIDESGNYDYCATTVNVQQNVLIEAGTPCVSPDDTVIAGTILTEAGEGLQGATVELNGNGNTPVLTDENGLFTFEAVAIDYDYSVSGMHDVDHDNGVTTFDLTMIKSHILNINTLDSPYKMIAADANNSESITTSDIVTLRRLILTMDEELANNTSWRFVDASFEFPNPQNPWEVGFPEVLNYNNFTASQLNADFVAIKIGDVNGNAEANINGNADERGTGEVLEFGVKNAAFQAGENITIDLTAKDYRDISSYQFTLDFATEGLEFVGVKTTGFASEADFGLKFIEEGTITVAHYNETTIALDDATVIFGLEFKTKAAGTPSDFIKVSSAKTTAIAYGNTAETMDIAFDFSATEEAFALYQNRPNPFTEATEIPFFLPTAGKATLTVFDVSGKLLKTVENDYTAGYHQIAVQREELGAGSVFYYQLDTENHSATRKMVMIK